MTNATKETLQRMRMLAADSTDEWLRIGDVLERAHGGNVWAGVGALDEIKSVAGLDASARKFAKPDMIKMLDAAMVEIEFGVD